MRLWDLASGRASSVLEGHGDVVRSVCWAGDRPFVLSGAVDKTVRLWDLAAGREVWKAETKGDVLSVTASADGRWAAAATYDRRVLLFELVWD